MTTKYYGLIYTMVDIERSNANREAHRDFLRRLVADGRIETGWKFPHYEPGALQGFLICKANSKDEVANWFREDPVIATGARTFEVRDAQGMSL